MNLEVCEYEKVKKQLEKFQELLKQTEAELENLDSSKHESIRQAYDAKNKNNQKIEKQHQEQQQKQYAIYEKQRKEIQEIHASMEQIHRQLMSENSNYRIVYDEMYNNPKIFKKFISCADAVTTSISLWNDYYEIYYNSIQKRILNLLTKSRRQEYEYLIVWRNTVDYYLKNFSNKMHQEMNIWENQQKNENSLHNQSAQNACTQKIETLEQNARQKRQDIYNAFSRQTNQLFSKEELHICENIFNDYVEHKQSVNQGELIRNKIIDLNLLGITIPDFVSEEPPLLTFLENKFQNFLEDDTLYLPSASTATNPISYFVTAPNREYIQNFMEQYLFSQILRVKASHLTLHVIDCACQGNSVNYLTPLSKQVPNLFGNGILTKEQDITLRLQELNQMMVQMRQKVFTSTTESIFDLDTEATIHVIALFDFPNGLTKESATYLSNLIREGAAFGIYVVIGDGNADLSRCGEDMRMQLEQIKQQCQEIHWLDPERASINQFSCLTMTVFSDESLQPICTSYAIASKLLERKQKILPNKLITWAESGDGDYAISILQSLQKEMIEHLKVRSQVPTDTTQFPKKILLGEILYPYGLFETRGDIFGAMCCWLGDENHICEPWYFDFAESQNLLVSMKESDVMTGQHFIHNIIWSFLSELPISKYNICVIDCERKGGSIGPFLELREQVPELFDDNIYTNTENVRQCLQRYNQMIEDCIQSKLGNRFPNILEYNRENEKNMETLHTLSIFDFPCGFDTKNMQLLLNILKNGPRCGIYTVIGYNEDLSVDAYDRSKELMEQIKELTTTIRAAHNKYLFTNSECQISIDLEKYLECSKEGSIYYEKTLNREDPLEEAHSDLTANESVADYTTDYEYVAENDFDYGDDTEDNFEDDFEDDYVDENWQIDAAIELEMDQELLLHTDEYGFLESISDKYSSDSEKWFLHKEDMQNFISTYANIVHKKKQEGLSFDNVLDETLFTRNSADYLEIPVGIGDQGKKISLTFGEKGTSSHHGLITGATGSGKSSLLHTMIMSAMLHYSPDQLHLYLLDFKNGTEFKIYNDYHLPHIQLLALDSMQEYGESILEKLVQVMVERATACKQVNAKNIADYVKSTGETMPRILVIMDEFQLLYNSSTNSTIARNCAELTKRLVTEGRAFGIHLLMSTQSARIISSLSLDKEVVGQMRIRVGLKCGEEDTRYLFGEQNERQAFDLMRGPIGTAVLNEDFVDGNNVGLRVVYCKETMQKEMLEKIAQQFADYKSNIIVFEGSQTTNLLDVIKKENTRETKHTQIAIGDLLKVSEHPLYLSYDRRKCHNTIIMGTDSKMSETISNGLCFTILHKPNTKVYCIDGEVLVGEEDALTIYDQFATLSPSFSLAEVYGDIIRFINEVYDALCKKKKAKDPSTIFVFIKNLQYLDLVKQMLKGEWIEESEYIDLDENEVDEGTTPTETTEDFFNFGLEVGDFSKKLNASSSTNKKMGQNLNVSQKLLKLITEGSSVGIHFIVSSLEFQTIKETLFEVNMNVNKLIQKFPERLLFSLNDMDAGMLIDHSVTISGLPDNTAYYTDSINTICMVKPFQFPKLEQLQEYTNKKGKKS